jgi:hypothetical protein
MEPLNAALLVNLLGSAVGTALYALLGLMVIRHRERPERVDLLLLTTSALGLVWNSIELYTIARRDFGIAETSPILAALAFACLGFLPSVVVHSAQADNRGNQWLTYAAYSLSAFATVMHFQAAVTGGDVPSGIALTTQTVGSVALLIGLLLSGLREALDRKAVWAAALLVFAVSALHLSGEREPREWYIELVAHQAALPLALVILYQNFRFAFADLFLKRAVSLLLLASLALGLYAFVAVPLLHYHETHDRNDAQAAAVIIGLWIATALAYPFIHRFASWLVDKVVLQRADYRKLQIELAREIESRESVDDVLETVCSRVSEALTARSVTWTVDASDRLGLPIVTFSTDHARVSVLTAEMPGFVIEMSEFAGGRRLLSEEVGLLDAVALLAARRIDLLRVSQERFDREFREQEFARLAAQAQVAALRSQINPHFLFNALTTLGYLIKTSPDKAYDTLLKLTRLLRGVLRSPGEFSTLQEEIDLVENYLDIERARFEERLRVNVEIDEDTRRLRIPSLILQPLVENAIKHGISENRLGGEIRIGAERIGNNGDSQLSLTVWDSGADGFIDVSPLPRTDGGVGLLNIRERLTSYYGAGATLDLRDDDGGTLAEVRIPLEGDAE